MPHTSNRAHFVSVDGLNDHEVGDLLDRADGFVRTGSEPLLAGKVVSPLFFQPSTRTRIGFEVAAHRLGAAVAGFADPNSSRASAATQESFEDTIRTVSAMADLIVVRSGYDRAGTVAASIASCPVVNAGDTQEHPSQALIDAFTMRHLLRDDLHRDLPDARVGFTGCVANRCTTPLIKLLSRLKVRSMTFLVERGHVPNAEVTALASSRGTRVDYTENLSDLLETCDVISAAPRDTRFIKDASRTYSDDATTMPPDQVITADAIRRTRSKAFVMHPLPRRNEISTDVDHLPNAAYFRQVRYSVPLRMAILDHVSNLLPFERRAAHA